MKRRLRAAICLLLSCPALFAQDQKTIEEQLRHTLENQLLLLRTPYSGKHLNFDSLGRILGDNQILPWTTNGLLQVKKVSVSKDTLKIEGQRGILAVNSDNTRVLPIAVPEPVYVAIQLARGPTGETVDQALRNVFSRDNIPERIQEAWKPFSADKSIKAPDAPAGTVGILAGGRYVYSAKSGASAPLPTYEPDPPYPSSEQKNTGQVVLFIVVNENGFPEILKVLRTSDEKFELPALSAVSQWRFRPAMKDGRSVAVEISVMIDFHR